MGIDNGCDSDSPGKDNEGIRSIIIAVDLITKIGERKNKKKTRNQIDFKTMSVDIIRNIRKTKKKKNICSFTRPSLIHYLKHHLDDRYILLRQVKRFYEY